MRATIFGYPHGLQASIFTIAQQNLLNGIIVSILKQKLTTVMYGACYRTVNRDCGQQQCVMVDCFALMQKQTALKNLTIRSVSSKVLLKTEAVISGVVIIPH